MKKVLLVLAVIAFTSCKHNATPAVTTVDSTQVKVDTIAVDTIAVDTIAVDTVAVDTAKVK